MLDSRLKTSARLLNPRVQEDYFDHILSRYTHLHKSSEDPVDSIEQGLLSMSLKDQIDCEGWADFCSKFSSKALQSPAQQPMDTSTVLAAMRKLREGLVASSRLDVFSHQVYFFIIYATILIGNFESFHPALLHLIRVIFARSDIAKTQKDEFVGFYILDLACRQGNLRKAFETRHVYACNDQNINKLLMALVRGDWRLYWKTYEVMNVYQKKLLQASHEMMRQHTINCVSASYLSVRRDFLEEAARSPWRDISRLTPKTWELDGEQILVRRIRKK